MEVCVSRVCLKRAEDVADTATVSDAIDDIFRKLRFKNIVAADSRLLVEQGRCVDIYGDHI